MGFYSNSSLYTVSCSFYKYPYYKIKENECTWQQEKKITKRKLKLKWFVGIWIFVWQSTFTMLNQMIPIQNAVHFDTFLFDFLRRLILQQTIQVL